MASVNALKRFAFSTAGAGGVGCSWSPQQNDAGVVWPKIGGIIGVTKRWIDFSCRSESVYLVATICFVVAVYILWCSPLWDGKAAGRVSSACGKCWLKVIENGCIICKLVCAWVGVLRKTLQTEIETTIERKFWCGGTQKCVGWTGTDHFRCGLFKVGTCANIRCGITGTW